MPAKILLTICFRLIEVGKQKSNRNVVGSDGIVLWSIKIKFLNGKSRILCSKQCQI